MRYLYVMVSRTDTGFARLIRRFTGCYYNHAAISFDCDLRQLYSFARRAYDLPLSACLTRESPLMYTRGQGDAQIVLYRLPVPDERFIAARRTVQMMLRDGGYIYNVWSVFTYPLTRGLPAYKAQTCSEFTAGILRIAGLRLERPDCRYHPEDFTTCWRGWRSTGARWLPTAVRTAVWTGTRNTCAGTVCSRSPDAACAPWPAPLTEACLNAHPACRMSPGSILPIPIAERGIIPCPIKWRIWSRRASSPSTPPGSG